MQLVGISVTAQPIIPFLRETDLYPKVRDFRESQRYAALTLAIILWVISATYALASEELSVTEISFNRALPHAFHDQAIASIAEIYPNGEVLVAERIAYVGNFIYALVAYRKDSTASEAYVDAVAVIDMRAWRLQGAFPVGELDRMRRDVLERIEQLR